jgi:hypothetical protein
VDFTACLISIPAVRACVPFCLAESSGIWLCSRFIAWDRRIGDFCRCFYRNSGECVGWAVFGRLNSGFVRKLPARHGFFSTCCNGYSERMMGRVRISGRQNCANAVFPAQSRCPIGSAVVFATVVSATVVSAVVVVVRDFLMCRDWPGLRSVYFLR